MLSDISVSRKPKRKKREDAPEDNSSKKKRRKTEERGPETLSTVGEPSNSSPTSTTIPGPSASEIEEYLQSNSITLTAAKNGPSITPTLSFDQLQIPSELKTALSDFQTPTPIQACSWPPALQGQDLVGIAETGRYDDVSILVYLGFENDLLSVGKHWHLAFPLSHT